MLRTTLRNIKHRLEPEDPLRLVQRRTMEVRDLECLLIALGWKNKPILDDPRLHEYAGVEDLNHRRLRDAEAILSACCNGQPRTILEIGTAHGHTTALMSRNAPAATIHTVNIPPEEIADGGNFTTFAPARADIGRVYRQAGCANVRQIFANTATWEPDLGPIDIAFIDGCHDTEFVYNDTVKILRHCKPGSLVLWHDFAPALAHQFDWINDVCLAIEHLCRQGILTDRIYHLADSWVGLYRVPETQA